MLAKARAERERREAERLPSRTAVRLQRWSRGCLGRGVARRAVLGALRRRLLDIAQISALTAAAAPFVLPPPTLREVVRQFFFCASGCGGESGGLTAQVLGLVRPYCAQGEGAVPSFLFSPDDPDGRRACTRLARWGAALLAVPPPAAAADLGSAACIVRAACGRGRWASAADAAEAHELLTRPPSAGCAGVVGDAGASLFQSLASGLEAAASARREEAEER